MPGKFQNHIVVPTDFSEQSIIALGQSYNLARFTKADITLVHVLDEDIFSSLLHVFKSHEEQEELLRAGVQSKLAALANEARAKSGTSAARSADRAR